MNGLQFYFWLSDDENRELYKTKINPVVVGGFKGKFIWF